MMNRILRRTEGHSHDRAIVDAGRLDEEATAAAAVAAASFLAWRQHGRRALL
jgi:hypothetical protein